MKKHRVIVGVVLVLGALVSARESAAQNIDLMAKWTAATVVNYKVTANSQGRPSFSPPAGSRAAEQ